MLRIVAQHLLRIRALAFRRLVAACVVLAMLGASLVSALATHHADDAHASRLSLSQILTGAADLTGDAAAREKRAGSEQPDHSQPDHSQPVADHDCHGCAAALLPAAPAPAPGTMTAAPVAAAGTLGFGRAVPTDLRPPRA